MTTPGPSVAVAGLGSMGSGMALSLLRAGLDVCGFDVSDAARDRFAANNGQAAPTPAEAARGRNILLCVVVNAAQTEAVLSAALPELAPGALVMSCATMAPAAARALAATVEATGRHFLDAPMSGGARRAAEGALTVLASGSAEAFAAARPVLDAVAATVHELGPDPGTGSSFKMVNQLLAGAHIAAAGEAVGFAARLGLDLRRVYEVITGSAGNSWMWENRVPHVLDGDYTPLSATSIFVKDLGIVLDMARAATFPVPVAGTALQSFLMTAAAGMGNDDDASVARLYARLAGLDLPGQ